MKGTCWFFYEPQQHRAARNDIKCFIVSWQTRMSEPDWILKKYKKNRKGKKNIKNTFYNSKMKQFYQTRCFKMVYNVTKLKNQTCCLLCGGGTSVGNKRTRGEVSNSTSLPHSWGPVWVLACFYKCFYKKVNLCLCVTGGQRRRWVVFGFVCLMKVSNHLVLTLKPWEKCIQRVKLHHQRLLRKYFWLSPHFLWNISLQFGLICVSGSLSLLSCFFLDLVKKFRTRVWKFTHLC